VTDIVDKLNETGIACNSYARSPAGNANFAITRHNNAIKVWQPQNLEVAIKTDKRKKHALLTVTEPTRRIPTKAFIYSTQDLSDLPTTQIVDFFGLDRIEEEARVIVPNGKCSVKKCQIEKYDYNNDYSYMFDIVWTVKKTTTTFLVGYDETDSISPFVCQLKRNVNSLREAYKELLPKGVTLKRNHKRQGEWFFNPVSEKMQATLFSKMYNAEKLCLDGIRHSTSSWFDERGEGNTHEGMVLYHQNKRYVIGAIKDRRVGRHKPLVLTKWHRVYRNNEVITKENAVWD